MGKVLAKLMKKLSADGPKRILMLGLDNAGNYDDDIYFTYKKYLL